MFLPYGFEHDYQRATWATWGLVLLCVVVHFAVDFPPVPGALPGMQQPDPTYGGYALVPHAFRPHQLITSQFLHAGVFHLIGNMVFLLVFGRYVEDRLGWWRFLVVYFACAVGGDLAYLAFDGNGPVVGASGAISGLMGWVLVAAPWLEMRALLWIGFYVSRPVTIASGWLLVPWILWELLGAWLSGGRDGIAVAAHVGGFAVGAGAAWFMRSDRCKGTDWYIDPLPPRSGKAVVSRLHEARGRPRATE